jgi:succinoglycan biosynthesis transport protein ExoP
MKTEDKTLADYIAILKRRLAVLLAAFVVVLVIGVFFAYSLPATYRSTGTIMIEQQNISADFVQTTVTTYADQQIEIVKQRVMSTPSLTAIVQKFGLYPEIVGPNAAYGAAETLRLNTFLERQSADIGDRALATIAFTLSFDHTDPVTAQQVAQELANLYVTENVTRRTNQAQLTVEFLQTSIDTARRDVDRTSAALAEFKDRHSGNLPELLDFHLSSIDRTEQQLANLDAEIRESRNRQFLLETQLATTNPLGNAVDENGEPIFGTADRLAQMQNERVRLLSIYSPTHPNVKRVEREIQLLTGGASGPAGAAADVQALRAQLATAQTELQQARRAYTEDHPDVVRLSRSVAVLQQQLEQAPTTTRSQTSALTALAARDPVVQQLNQQILTEKAYLQSQLVRRADLEGKLDELRRNVAAMPQIEREYEALTRENEFATTRYNEAIGQLDTAQRAQTLETEGSGDRFTLLEPPILPSRPYKPNRMLLVMLVMVIAVGAGIGVATLVDVLDSTLKGTSDVVQLTGAPPLAVIPFLETTTDRRRRLAMNVATVTALVGGVATAIGIAVAMG